MMTAATGSSVIRVSLPPGSSGYTMLNDLGFGLKGYDVSFVNDPSLVRTRRQTGVKVEVFVPADDDSLPVKVTFAPRSLNSSLKSILLGTSSEGSANRWITLDV